MQGHHDMLQDSERNELYASAIACAVEDVRSARATATLDDEVHSIDIGTGSSLLACMAASHSVKVIAFESDPMMCRIARCVVLFNGHRQAITVVEAHSTKAERVGGGWSLPAHTCEARGSKRTSPPWSDPVRLVYPQAHILVHEIFDSAVFGEGLLPTLRHAWDVLCSPNTISVPAAVRVYAQLVACSYFASASSLTHQELLPTPCDVASCEGSNFIEANVAALLLSGA